MKKKFLGIVAAVAVVAIAGVNYLQMNQSVELSDLALANVEALANPEGPTGTGQSNRVITDEIRSMEVLSYGIKTTYYRHCSYGGSSYCVSGTWSDFTPR